jgi:AmiR/NasT family two-component response regulator
VTDTVQHELDGPLLVERVRQLETALESRVVIEQAKGVLAGRHGIDVGAAFHSLRSAARATRQRLHDLARRVVDERETPDEVRRRLPGAARHD